MELKDQIVVVTGGSRGIGAAIAELVSERGGVPVIEGPESDDVLDILSSMLAGGAITTFDCDPTVISYDDLWRRPGGGAPTLLGLALSDVREHAGVRMCAIRRAELSPSQFWIDTVRRAGKQRLIPNELLLCIARAGDAEDETKDPSAFRAEGWIDRTAGAHALSSIEDEAFARIVDLSHLALDPLAALAAMGTTPLRLPLADARWLAQFVPVAKAVLKADAGAFVKEVLDVVASDAKPALKLIDNRGPSRA